MASTRAQVKLSDDGRNIARFNTSDVPPSLYVPNQAAATLSPIKVGKSLNTFWTIPNGTFPMPGSARWWNLARASSSATQSTATVSTNAWIHPLSVARTATLLGVAVNATTISSTTSQLYACIFQYDNGTFSQVYSGLLDAITTASGLRIVPMNFPLVAGLQYALSFGGTGFTLTTITENAAPRWYPTAGTYDPIGSVAYQGWQAASLYIPYVAGTAAQNLSSFGWSNLNNINGVAMVSCALQLRTV